MIGHIVILVVEEEGQVCPYASVANAHAGSMFICRTLSEKYNQPFDAFGVYRAQAISSLFGTPEMSNRDSIVLGFTFDRVWVRHQHLERLSRALRSFYEENDTYVALDGDVVTVPPALIDIAAILDELQAERSLRGVCFQQTSMAWNVWILENGEPPTYFNFDTDEFTRDGGEPWELFDALDKK